MEFNENKWEINGKLMEINGNKCKLMEINGNKWK